MDDNCGQFTTWKDRALFWTKSLFHSTVLLMWVKEFSPIFSLFNLLNPSILKRSTFSKHSSPISIDSRERYLFKSSVLTLLQHFEGISRFLILKSKEFMSNEGLTASWAEPWTNDEGTLGLTTTWELLAEEGVYHPSYRSLPLTSSPSVHSPSR